LKDINVICNCGQEMIKIEDVREGATQHNCPNYPTNQMEFVCECGKDVDLIWNESEMEVVKQYKGVSR